MSPPSVSVALRSRLCRLAPAALVVLVSGAASCAGADVAPPEGPAEEPARASVLVHTPPTDPVTGLVFPPSPRADRRDRLALPERLQAAPEPAAEAVEVRAPELYGGGEFEIWGRTIEVQFSHQMAGAAADVPAGALVTIRPAVAGLAKWTSADTLQFTASRPFDPEVTYELELPVLKSAGGAEMASPFQAKFTATPDLSIANKQLHHLPKAGEPRVIATHPSSRAMVGAYPTLWVLFDQAVDLRLARGLITLTDEQDQPVPMKISHPGANRLEGVKVDRRFVALVRPLRALRHGEKLVLQAHDHRPVAKRKEWTVKFSVADPLRFKSVACGWYAQSDEVCDYSGGKLRTSEREIHVLFNNPIGTASRLLPGRVQITPAVRGLRVRREGYDSGRLVLRGGFKSSTSYRVFIAGLSDQYGYRQSGAVRFSVRTMPLAASVSMAEGLILLDDATSRRFEIASRNVAEASLQLWPVPNDDAKAFRAALRRVHGHTLSQSPPTTISVPIQAVTDTQVKTTIDLTTKLTPGESYLATIKPTKYAAGAGKMKFPTGSAATRPPVALLRVGTPDSLAVHAHATPSATVVHVARLASGEPVSGAQVGVAAAGAVATVTTDAHGVAVMTGVSGGGDTSLLRVAAGGQTLLFPLSLSDASAKELFPDLAGGSRPASPGARRIIVYTDRGIYRPGAKVHVKASVFRPDGAGLRPMPGQLLRLRLVGPTRDTVLTQSVVSGTLGGMALDLELASDAKLGLHELRIEDPLRSSEPLAQVPLRVAAFEPPRFAVDVHAGGGGVGSNLRAAVHARYLFGAPMDGASVEWSLRRSLAAMPSGPLTDAGLVFRPEPRWYEEEPELAAFSRTGSGYLAADGTFAIDQPVAVEPNAGPQRFVMEADVTDSSYRHVAASTAVVKHPASRYAGLRAPGGWVGVGQKIPVELGVIDTTGKPVVGKAVMARLDRLSWHHVRRRVAGGALRWQWTTRTSTVGRCTVQSAITPNACELVVPRSGDYELTALVDGRPGGKVSFWAWRDGDSVSQPAPKHGSVIQVVADKARYAPGERARVLVRNPYPEATAILTAEMGQLVSHQSQRLTGSAGLFELPIGPEHAPYVHATVTLLPIGATGEDIASYRVGAVRLPVSLAAARLDLELTSDRPTYGPGEHAKIRVRVRDGGKPDAHAEVALAVVDEGVLRMTGFHALDPVRALRPGRPLSFHLRDSRDGLAELFERSHVAGGGGEGGETERPAARRNFVKTALWRPLLRTDANGIAEVELPLPDNLTEFRMMAVALDDDGKGASVETSFTVRKPVMLLPVVPRFATVGDEFEVAAMLHNTGRTTFQGTVQLGERSQAVSVPAHGRKRVGFAMSATAPGPLKVTLAVSDALGERDRVEKTIPVQQPGLAVRPRLEGAFTGEQEIALRVPASIVSPPDGVVEIKVGQQMWPELGARLEYLLDYPHGCVEQTTSSTLPLIAARDILPRIGVTHIGPEYLNERIQAGLERLHTMRTSGGGLAYWPGGNEPNVYGTAYAIRAVIRAKKAGVTPPEGLLAGMSKYLSEHLLESSVEPEVRAAIAQSLAELGDLPPSSADALYGMAGDMSVFGQAALAIALSSLPQQTDRVGELLGMVEKSFDGRGELLKPSSRDDFSYFGSNQRTRAQAAIALGRLRPRSPLHPQLVADLAQQREGYTTQATAYSLLAVAEQLAVAEDKGGGSPIEVELDGRVLEPAQELDSGALVYRVALGELRGKQATLRLRSAAVAGFMLSSAYRLPATAPSSLASTSATKGPDLYRVYTDPSGAPIDLGAVKAGELVRVALLVRLSDTVPRNRRGYLAITDHLPAGFEPVQTELATVAAAPDISDAHPFASALRYGRDAASHVEMHDDRVNVYFDRLRSREVVASYLVRATTPGRFSLPPASAELMYESNSTAYSAAGRVAIR